MPTFPSTLEYSEQGYSYTVAPDVLRTVFSTRNTRQRLLRTQRDDLFNVSIRTDNAGLAVFEAFVTDDIDNGADQFDGTYYVSDVEDTGTLEIVEGRYTVTYLADDQWDINYQFEVKGHDITWQTTLYDTVIEYGSFSLMGDILDALEDCVNNNDL